MKISIIIPTRERAYYLDASIRTVLEIDDPDIELIVADNASTDNTREVIEAFDDPRLIYLPSSARVSMRENFNRSLCASSGDYIIFIGDDDAIVSGQFRYLRRLLEQHRPDGISWSKFTYGWPIEGFGKKTGGVRFYRGDLFRAPQPYDPKTYFDALMSCQLHRMNPTPNIYHGCVSRAYMDRIAPEDGLYFDSTIPDVNFQYRATVHGGNFLHMLHPISINGYNPLSNGGSQARAKKGTEAARIAQAFEAENRVDPYEDVMDQAQTIQLVFMSTLESLRARMPEGLMSPDHLAWYRYALNALKQKPEQADRIDAALIAHAERSGTQDALAQARIDLPAKRKTFAQRRDKWRAQLHSFRLSAAEDGQNTVLTAVHTCDAVLARDYNSVLDGDLSTAAAWAAAKKRSKGFQRTL